MDHSRTNQLPGLHNLIGLDLAKEILRGSQRLNSADVLELLAMANQYGGGECTALRDVCVAFAKSRIADLRSDMESFKASKGGAAGKAARLLLPKTMGPRRIVRQTPVIQRILAAPSDVYLQSNEWLSLVDWERYHAKAGKGPRNAAGIALNLVYLVLKAWAGDAFVDDELFAEPRRAGTLSVAAWFRSIFTVASLVEVLLIAISIANTVWLFNSSKSYTLFDQPTE
ncbi:hypothetical protein HK405_000365, partial [Cladochytrium tenue]